MRETNAELLGKDVIDQTETVYGLDEEGEINGSYRPSGHPGVRPCLFIVSERRDTHSISVSSGSPPATSSLLVSSPRRW